MSVPAAPDDLPPPPEGAEEIRRRAEEILSRPEFRQPSKTLWERITAFLDEHLGRALDALFGGGRGSVVAWLILLAALALVVWLVWRVAGGVRRERAAASTTVTAEARRTPVDWLREAARFESAGEWREAVRARYRALVADLADRGLVDEIPGRTAGEYRLEVAESAPRSAGDFGAATDIFERAWYGSRPTGPDDHRRFREFADRVVAGVR